MIVICLFFLASFSKSSSHKYRYRDTLYDMDMDIDIRYGYDDEELIKDNSMISKVLDEMENCLFKREYTPIYSYKDLRMQISRCKDKVARSIYDIHEVHI